MKAQIITALSALTLIAMATAAFAAPTASLTIDRPHMREMYVTWQSMDDSSANCLITQRLTLFSPWETMKMFSLASGATIAINMDNTSPIYSEQKVECVSGSVDIITTSTYKIFGGSSQASCPVVNCPTTTTLPPVVCPVQPSCQANGEACSHSGHSLNCCNGMKCEDNGWNCPVWHEGYWSHGHWHDGYWANEWHSNYTCE